jgi:hypothetical protein
MIDSKKLTKLSKKLLQVDGMLAVLNGPRGCFLNLTGEFEPLELILTVSCDDKANYALSEKLKKALLEYRESVEREILSTARPR